MGAEVEARATRGNGKKTYMGYLTHRITTTIITCFHCYFSMSRTILPLPMKTSSTDSAACHWLISSSDLSPSQQDSIYNAPSVLSPPGRPPYELLGYPASKPSYRTLSSSVAHLRAVAAAMHKRSFSADDFFHFLDPRNHSDPNPLNGVDSPNSTTSIISPEIHSFPAKPKQPTAVPPIRAPTPTGLPTFNTPVAANILIREDGIIVRGRYYCERTVETISEWTYWQSWFGMEDWWPERARHDESTRDASRG